MEKDIITTINNNIKQLKYCMNICEAQLWGGPRHIKQKYLKQLGRLKMKMKEQLIDKKYYEDVLEYYPKIYQVLLT
tara:strand:+ start:447 stop:674 length:228 start_codon:yes stop_codon:yes gene_type:complete